MNITKKQRNNIIFLVIIALILIPQTRQPIQIVLHKGLALFSPSIEDESELNIVANYNWKLKDINGNNYNFNQSEGRVVLVNFWATWCAPCRTEMPMLSELQAQLEGPDFEVLTIATGRNPPGAVKRFFDKAGISNLPQHHDPKQKLARQMAILGLPVSVILNRQGDEIARLRGDADWSGDSAKAILNALIAAP